MSIHIKRAYEPAEPTDGYRVLVDRVWPRGRSKDALRLDEWMKDIAPSAALRRWFGHAPARFAEFRTRYLAELESEPGRALLEELARRAARGRVTLVYGAKDEVHNQAVVLAEAIRRRSPRA